MSRAPPDIRLVAAAVLIAMAAAWGGFALLRAAAQPSHAHERLLALEDHTARIERAHREFGDPGAYAQRAICQTRLSEAGDRLKTRLSQAAASVGLPSPTVSLDTPGSFQPADRLVPIVFEVDVKGRYEAVLGLLRLLEADEPEIFADTLDLTSDTKEVSLKLTGRVLCSTSDA